MDIRDFDTRKELIAGDHTILREFINAHTEDVPLRYSLAYATVRAGNASTRHRMRTSEVYYILGGFGRMHIDDEAADVHAGQAVIIPPGAVQWIENIGDSDLCFLAIVDPAWKPEDEEIL